MTGFQNEKLWQIIKIAFVQNETWQNWKKLKWSVKIKMLTSGQN